MGLINIFNNIYERNKNKRILFAMIILSSIYRSLISSGEKHIPTAVKRIIQWEHPAGPKTIHFWAPFMKWSLVIAGAADMARPAEKLSKNQTISLLATGTIWSRYSMVIPPKNYSLFLVNMFLAGVACVQLTRIFMYEQELAKKQQLEAKEKSA